MQPGAHTAYLSEPCACFTKVGGLCCHLVGTTLGAAAWFPAFRGPEKLHFLPRRASGVRWVIYSPGILDGSRKLANAPASCRTLLEKIRKVQEEASYLCIQWAFALSLAKQ